ncbi:MAG TPA: helix-turn-helix transcriptional regulator [Thermoanaerobaculia bacterium]|nr:helix-turn-helix transcriptional regulator [Thermoanaerobaculia bacterium]
MLQAAFGEVLRGYRKRMEPRPTQAQLSALAGLPATVIGDLERGWRTVKGPELTRICRALGVRVGDFLAEVMKAQLLALGESVDEKPAEEAKALDLYLTVPFQGDLDSTVRALRDVFKKLPKLEEKV